jgi:hypothetical protein
VSCFRARKGAWEEIPKSQSQNPNKLQIPKSNSLWAGPRFFGLWSLDFIWILDFGIWDLSFGIWNFRSGFRNAPTGRRNFPTGWQGVAKAAPVSNAAFGIGSLPVDGCWRLRADCGAGGFRQKNPE